MRFLLPFVILAVLTVSACSVNAGPAAPADPTVLGHIHGLEQDPADGTVYVATHSGVFSVGAEGARRVGTGTQDTMGFTLAGPGSFYGSGHPGPNEPGPPQLGLIRSDDAARTWQALSLQGAADLHALSVSGQVVQGWDSVSGALLRSEDGGITWTSGAVADIADLDVDPSNSDRVVVTTAAGLQTSSDGGRTLEAHDVQPPRLLQFIDHGVDAANGAAPVGVDVGGAVWTWAGDRWERAGELPGPAQAFTVVDGAHFLAATHDAVLATEDAGRSWQVLAPAE